MWLTGSARLAEAEPGYAEIAAALDGILVDGTANVFDPGDMAVILDKPADDVRRLFDRATDPAIDLFVKVDMVVCPRCEALTPRERVEADFEEYGEGTCTRCGHPLDLATALIHTKYRLSETAAVEARALERRPQ